ncbi:ParM/StbA family protein [Ureibacillus sp. FSL K6-2830]|uniref:ParM/StbA family protein n=1 Tax=Ureibacillus sp. FSL K6-2830 TaxID=2954610 RepID=UPI0030F9F36B
MDKLILGVDAGNYKGKVAGVYGVDSFKTNICNWFERDVDETFGPDDMEFEINGRKGYAGTIAMYEDEFGDGATYGDTKAHEDTKIRILLAIYRYTKKYCPDAKRIYLVTGQPINRHKDEEKTKIINMLIGYYDFSVNGQRVRFAIEDVKVAPEGSAAFWSTPATDMKIIDVGSGTVNLASIIDKKHIHKSSGTMNTGIETLRNKNDYEALARAIYQQATKLKWKNTDVVFTCGGVAEIITPYLKKHFYDAIPMQPKLKREFDTIQVPPTYANAVGFYNLARGVFK